MPLATESQLTLEVVWFGLGWFGPRPGAVWCSLLRFVAFLFDNRQHIGITNLQHRSSAAHQTLDHPQRDAPVLVLGKDPTAHASKDGRRCHASPDEPRHLNRIWIQSKLDHLASCPPVHQRPAAQRQHYARPLKQAQSEGLQRDRVFLIRSPDALRAEIELRAALSTRCCGLQLGLRALDRALLHSHRDARSLLWVTKLLRLGQPLLQSLAHRQRPRRGLLLQDPGHLLVRLLRQVRDDLVGPRR
mmetsp:Transcript_392/g.1481  ORF Transcript_392/g.1481 Transcript_392/m.1481 type:complete len:245 (+) Transcript_392:82-816(+)